MNSCHVDLKYFKVLGFLDLVTTNSRRSYILFTLLLTLFSFHVAVQVFDTLIGDYEFSLFTEKFAVNLTMFESSVKMSYYIYKRATLKHLADIFDENLLSCSKLRKKKADRILCYTGRKINSAVKGFVIMIFSTVSIWNVLPIIESVRNKKFGKLQITPSWYPFDATIVPLNFFVYIYEFGVMVYCATLLYVVNCLFYSYALFLTAQIQVLNDCLSHTHEIACNHLNLSNSISVQPVERIKKQALMHKLLHTCISDHNTLLNLTNLMEELYNPMFLFQMLTSTVTICLVLLQINVQVNGNATFVASLKFVMYLLFGLIELFVYSWGGQIIYDQSGDLHESFYNSGWEGCSPRYRKDLLFAMTRANKCECLTAGKFYNVNLASFTQIVKASYSFFNFLHGSDKEQSMK